MYLNLEIEFYICYKSKAVQTEINVVAVGFI